MPSYKDEARKTWYCQFYYTDWTGQRRKKKKRGFPTSGSPGRRTPTTTSGSSYGKRLKAAT